VSLAGPAGRHVRQAVCQNRHVYISAKVDYAVRALCTLADADGRPVTAESLAQAQGLPPKFLESILNDMRRAGLLISQRGADGGYRLSRPAGSITVAEVMRPLDGPLAEVRGLRPEATSYGGSAEHLQDVWVAVRASLRAVLDRVTIADIVTGELPRSVAKLTTDPDAWLSR
jgi:Rrf2 family protein